MNVTAVALDAGADQALPGVGLRLWLADLDAQPCGSVALPADVEERASRFVHEVDRRRYRAAHAAIQGLLPRGERTVNACGKPALANGPHFNLSRRDGWAAIALSATHEVGVDLETVRRIEDASELAAMHFTPTERAAVQACGAQARDRAFLTVWTRKEACMKATGLGLRLAPSSFECGALPEPRRLRVSSGGRSWTLVVHTPHSGNTPVIVSWAVALA